MPRRCGGTKMSRDPARLSSEVTSAIWCAPSLISENNSLDLSIQVRPEAFGSHRRGSPPKTCTDHVSQMPPVTA